MQDSLNLPSFGASTEMGKLLKEANSRKTRMDISFLQVPSHIIHNEMKFIISSVRHCCLLLNLNLFIFFNLVCLTFIITWFSLLCCWFQFLLDNKLATMFTNTQPADSTLHHGTVWSCQGSPQSHRDLTIPTSVTNHHVILYTRRGRLHLGEVRCGARAGAGPRQQHQHRVHELAEHVLHRQQDAPLRHRLHHRPRQPRARDPPRAHRERDERRQNELLALS